MMGVGAKRALGLYRSCAPRHLKGRVLAQDAVEDAVAKRIGVVGVADGGVPLLDGKLRRDER